MGVKGSFSETVVRWTFCAALLFSNPLWAAGDNRFVVFEGGKHGYIDGNGTLMIRTDLEGTYVLSFKEGRASFAESVKPKPQRVPYVDDKGKLHVFPQQRWGFIDTDGNIIVQPKYDAVLDFSENLAGVGLDTDRTDYSCLHCDRNQRWGFIDKQGALVIAPAFRHVRSFSEGLAAVEDESGKWGYIDTEGRLVIPFLFTVARSFREGLAAAAVDAEVGFIDKRGTFVVKPRFAVAGDFSGRLAPARAGGKTGSLIVGPAGGTWTFIGADGNVKFKLPKDTENAAEFSEGRAAITVIGGRCGYVDAAGKVVISVKFSGCGDFSEGLAAVLVNGKWAYIDHDGKVVLRVPYDEVRGFVNGLASVQEGTSGPTQRFGYIDKLGHEVWKPRTAI